MKVDLTSKTVLKALPAKPNSPYWMRIEKGRHIGYRKIDADHATWLARRRLDADDRSTKRGAAATPTGSLSYEFHALGTVTQGFDYSAAKRKAEEWFKNRDGGVSDEPVTIEKICKEYVEDRRTQKGEKTAYDAQVRFKRTVYDKPIGAVRLNKITTKRLKEWRAAIPGTPSAQDREWRTLRAALNLACFVNRRVSRDRAIEWEAVPPLTKADGRRDLYLDLKQRRALLRAAPKGRTRDTIQLVALTGCRPGEAVALTRGDVDLKLGTVRFRGKTGTRVVPLSPAALKLFKKLCRSKLPAAPLVPWNHSVEWSREIRDTAKRAGLPEGTCLYSLRHSWISQMLIDGAPSLTVARLCGTSLLMLEKNYGHLIADSAAHVLEGVQMV